MFTAQMQKLRLVNLAYTAARAWQQVLMLCMKCCKAHFD